MCLNIESFSFEGISKVPVVFDFKSFFQAIDSHIFVFESFKGKRAIFLTVIISFF